MTVARELAARDAREALYRMFRNVRPARVTVVDCEGDERAIALSRGKGRWDLACDAIVSMLDDVERVELLAEDGAIMRTWTPPDALRSSGASSPAPSSPATPAPPPETQADRELARLEAYGFRLLAEVQRVTDETVKRHLASTDKVQEKLVEVLGIVTEQNRTLMKQQTSVLRTVYDATIAKARADAGNGAGDEAETPADKLIGQVARMLLGDNAPAQSSAAEPEEETETH